MQPSATKSLTVNEAASVTGVPLKHVHRIIDAGLIRDFVKKERGSRLIAERALIALRLAYLTANALTPSARQRILDKTLADQSQTSVDEAPLRVDLQPVIRDVEDGLDRLEHARRAVTSDTTILGGEPVFSGTRIAVHDIADMLASGGTVEAIAEAYPQLHRDQIAIAPDYALAYPRRGRPRAKPAWRSSAPKSSRTLTLDDLPAAK